MNTLKLETRAIEMERQEMSYFKTNFPLTVETYHLWSAIAGTVLAFFLEIGMFAFLLFALIIADLITGIIRAKKKKSKISGWGIHRTIEKIVVEMLAVLMTKLFQVILVPDIDITFVVVFVIATSELKSVYENISEILGFELWEKVKAKLKDVIK